MALAAQEALDELGDAVSPVSSPVKAANEKWQETVGSPVPTDVPTSPVVDYGVHDMIQRFVAQRNYDNMAIRSVMERLDQRVAALHDIVSGSQGRSEAPPDLTVSAKADSAAPSPTTPA